MSSSRTSSSARRDSFSTPRASRRTSTPRSTAPSEVGAEMRVRITGRAAAAVSGSLLVAVPGPARGSDQLISPSSVPTLQHDDIVVAIPRALTQQDQLHGIQAFGQLGEPPRGAHRDAVGDLALIVGVAIASGRVAGHDLLPTLVVDVPETAPLLPLHGIPAVKADGQKTTGVAGRQQPLYERPGASFLEVCDD